MPLDIKIITPLRTALQEQVHSVHLPSSQGEIEILPDHTDLIASLSHGELTYRPVQGGSKQLFIGGGFLQVEKNHVLIVTDIAVDSAEVDMNTVEEAVKRAEAALRNQSSVLSREEQAYLETRIAQQLALLDFKKKKR